MQAESSKLDQKLSEYLWKETEEYHKQALNSNFIYGLRERRLDPSEFGGYMVDDSVYCYEVIQSLKLAAQRSKDNSALQKFLESKAESWKGAGAKSCNTWHIKNADGIQLGDAAAKYVAHIRRVAEHEVPVYTILALTPCAKLWPWLGEQIGSGTYDFGLYTSWVEKNLDPKSRGFQEYQDYVERAYEEGIVTAEKALKIFTTSIQSEVDFFNSVARCQAASYS